ncbi:MAG: hypothetical protein GKR87_05630 [Kiritimatiellae bacterium]|nr:hypothetical protein [Kiritimatiellia bacterium]
MAVKMLSKKGCKILGTRICTISRASIQYMKALKQKPPYFRFDVVEVIGTEEGCHSQTDNCPQREWTSLP